MKIALYIEDGLEQIVLTPESDTEAGILGKMHDGSRDMSISRGSFYACRGGWVRQSTVSTRHSIPSEDDDSTMIVLRRQATRTEELAGYMNTEGKDA